MRDSSISLRIAAGPLYRPLDGALIQRLEGEDLAAGKEGGVQRERGVLRRRTDEQDAPLLEEREEDVLLGPVEPVYLIEEEKVALPFKGESTAGPIERPSHLLDPGQSR